MRVYHYDTDTLLLLHQEEGLYFVKTDGDERTNAFADLCAALWNIIEQIRNTALTKVNDRVFRLATKRIDPKDKPSMGSLLRLLKERNIHKVFYDTAFLSMLTHHNSKKKYDLILENKTNFFLYDEIAYIIKMHKKKVLEGSSF